MVGALLKTIARLNAIAMVRLFVLSSLTLQVACTSSGPRYSELPTLDLHEKAEVVIFRKGKFAAAGQRNCIVVDGTPLGVLSSGSFLRAALDPGDHQILIAPNRKNIPATELTIHLIEGDTVFLFHNIQLISLVVIPVGVATIANSSWNEKLVEVPQEFWDEHVTKIGEAEYSDECPDYSVL